MMRMVQIGVLFPQLRRQRRDHIIRLEPFRPDQRNTDLLQQRHAPIDLRRHRLRNLRPVGLVLGIDLRPECSAVSRHIQRHRDVVGPPAGRGHVRPLAAQELEQHPHEPEGHVRRFLGDRRGHRRPDGVVRPEELAVSVDEVEGGHVREWVRRASRDWRVAIHEPLPSLPAPAECSPSIRFK